MVTFQGVIVLMYIKEDLIKHLLPHSHNLLGQVGFQGDVHVAATHAKDVQCVVELNGHCEADIQYPHHRIKKELY